MELWRNKDDWRDRLAQWFAPTLVIAPEYSSPQGKQRGAPDEDYHPRDIRLVLRGVADSPKQKGGVVLDFVSLKSPIRGFLGGVWTPFSAIETLARSWPRQVLVLSAIIATGWLGVLSRALYFGPGFLFHWHWYVVSGTYGLLMALALIAAVEAIWCVPRHWSFIVWFLVFVLIFATLPMAIYVCWHMPVHTAPGASLWSRVVVTSGPRLTALSLILLGAIYTVAPFRRWLHETDPLKLLGRLEKIAKADVRHNISVSLRYIAAGQPNDPVTHRRRYWRMLVESKSKREPTSYYPRTAYAHVVTGLGEDSRLIAIQYWFAYYYDDWANKHEMDWEQVTVFLCKTMDTPEPTRRDVKYVACGFSQHFSGAAVPWNDRLERKVRRDAQEEICGIGPLVYVARGSHANYPRPGRYRPFTTIAGLRFTGKDLGFLGQSAARYIDICLPRPQRRDMWTDTVELSVPAPTVSLEANRARPDDNVLRVITLPEDPPPDKWWTHDVADPDHHCEVDAKGVCVGDFRWLNLHGLWGSPGRIFGGDDAPKSPPQKDEWADPFFWLAECEPYARSFGRVLLDRALAAETAVEPATQPATGDGRRS